MEKTITICDVCQQEAPNPRKLSLSTPDRTDDQVMREFHGDVCGQACGQKALTKLFDEADANPGVTSRDSAKMEGGKTIEI